MNDEIEMYLKQNPNTPRKTTEENNRIREKEAFKQTKSEPVPCCKVFSYVNDFLELLRVENGFAKKNNNVKSISLDNSNQMILNNGIIAKGCNWIVPEWDDCQKKYVVWEPKYSIIKNKFGLDHTKNIIWLA